MIRTLFMTIAMLSLLFTNPFAATKGFVAIQILGSSNVSKLLNRAKAKSIEALGYITISNPNNVELTNFQIKVTGMPVDTKYTIVDPTGKTIPYCFEQPNGECNNLLPSATIWLKVHQIPAKGTVRLTLKKTQKVVAVNGNQVFDLYDDFSNGIDWSKWQVSSPGGDNGKTAAVSQSDVCIVDGKVHLDCKSKNLVSIALLSKKTFSNFAGHTIELSFQQISGKTDDDAVALVFAYQSISNTYFAVVCFGDTSWGASTALAARNVDSNESVGDATRKTPVDTAMHTIKVDYISADTVNKVSNVAYYLDGHLVSELNIPTNDYKDFFAYQGRVGFGTFYMQHGALFDWIRVRKYAPKTPVVSVEIRH